MNKQDTFLFSFLIIGAMSVTFGVNTIYAQEEQNTVDLGFNIGYIIAGMVIMLIPFIRNELNRRNVNPAVKNLLDQTESILQGFVTNKEQLLQLAQISYSGLPQDYVNAIEGKPKVKLLELQKDVLAAQEKLQKFLEIYSQLKPKI